MVKPNGKIRIGYLIDTISSDKAGTEKQMLQIIARLDKEQYTPWLICLYESRFMRESALPCPSVSLGYRGFLHPSIVLVLWRFLKLLREHRFHVVQTFFEDAMLVGFFGKVLSRAQPTLVVSRRDLGLGADEPVYHRFFKLLHPWVYRAADGIVANAAIIKNSLEASGVPGDRITLIRNGIADPATPATRPVVFEQHPNDVWIAIVANLKPIKRIDVFLKAFRVVTEKLPQLRIGAIVLGEGRLRQELEVMAAALGIEGAVHFVGAVDNVTDYLHFCDVGVLCSDKEGLSNAILEYMGCGLPVVATAVGGNIELVDETNGVRIAAGDHEGLGNACWALIGDPFMREKLGVASLAKVRSMSTWEAVMPQWESYYRAMAVQGGADV